MPSRRKWSYNDAYEKRNVACSSCGQLVVQSKGSLYDIVQFPVGPGDNARLVETTVEHMCDIEARFHYQESIESVAREALSALAALDLEEDQVGQTGPAEEPLSREELADMGEEVNAKYRKVLALVYEMSLTMECPRCGAGIGERCENLTDRKKSVLSYTKHPHKERVSEDAIKQLEADNSEYNAVRDYSVSQKRLDDEWRYFREFNERKRTTEYKAALIHRAEMVKEQLEELLTRGGGDEQSAS